MTVAVDSEFSSPAMVSVAAMMMASDQQADQADRQLREDEGRDDVVDVGEPADRRCLRAPGPRPCRAPTAAPPRAAAAAVFAAGSRAGSPASRAAARLVAASRRASNAASNSVCSAAYAGADSPDSHALRLDRAEQQRRRVEHVEHEDEHAEDEHQKLQRDLPVGAHQQRVPRFVDRPRGQVALHLALIGAEVRAEEEQRRDGAGPEGVRFVRSNEKSNVRSRPVAAAMPRPSRDADARRASRGSPPRSRQRARPRSAP